MKNFLSYLHGAINCENKMTVSTKIGNFSFMSIFSLEMIQFNKNGTLKLSGESCGEQLDLKYENIDRVVRMGKDSEEPDYIIYFDSGYSNFKFESL